MDYLFLHRDKRTFTSERQKNLLFRAARLYWEQKYADNEVVPKRKVDCELYKYVLYYLEVRQVFLDPKLSLKKLSDMIETNQTYLSNVVNRYFGCHLKELVNTYRVEYAKELLRSGKCPPEELPQRCGFLSRSAFYAAFKKVKAHAGEIADIVERIVQCAVSKDAEELIKIIKNSSNKGDK